MNSFWRSWGCGRSACLWLPCCALWRRTTGCNECYWYPSATAGCTTSHVQLLLQMQGYHSRICSKTISMLRYFEAELRFETQILSKTIWGMQNWCYYSAYWNGRKIGKDCFWKVCWIEGDALPTALFPAFAWRWVLGLQLILNAGSWEEGAGAWWIEAAQPPAFEWGWVSTTPEDNYFLFTPYALIIKIHQTHPHTFSPFPSPALKQLNPPRVVTPWSFYSMDCCYNNSDKSIMSYADRPKLF